MERNQNYQPSFEELAGIPKDGEKPGFTGVWIPAEIYEDKRLKSIDRDLYGQIAGFKNGCWIKSSELQERLGVSKGTFQASCSRLKEYGYIDDKRVFGRMVRWSTLAFQSSAQKLHRTKNCAVHRHKNCADEQTKNCAVHIEQRKNKERTNNKGADAPAVEEKEKANEPKTYGNQQVNEFLQAWKEETGDDFSKDTRERRATWNLIKGKTSEATKALLTAVGEARRSGDRFAPQIASPSDLVGKYSKINKLRLWVMRNEENEEPHPPYWSWQKLPPQDDLTDEERAATQRAFKEARASGKFKWLKPKEENDAE